MYIVYSVVLTFWGVQNILKLLIFNYVFQKGSAEETFFYEKILKRDDILSRYRHNTLTDFEIFC